MKNRKIKLFEDFSIELLVNKVYEEMFQDFWAKFHGFAEGFQRIRGALDDVQNVVTPVVLPDGVGEEPITHVLFFCHCDAAALELFLEEFPAFLVLGFLAGKNHHRLVGLHDCLILPMDL